MFDSVLFIAKVVEDLENKQADEKHPRLFYAVLYFFALIENTAMGAWLFC